MTLWEVLLQALERNNSGLKLMRAKHALTALSGVLGSDFNIEASSPSLAQFVEVPGSPEKWIVFSSWEDGTCDIIKQDGMFPEDVLVGWTPGQTVAEYFAQLDTQYNEEEPPLQVTGAPSRWRDRKKTEFTRQTARPELRTPQLRVVAESHKKRAKK
jgi:hypothetical protein